MSLSLSWYTYLIAVFSYATLSAACLLWFAPKKPWLNGSHHRGTRTVKIVRGGGLMIGAGWLIGLLALVVLDLMDERWWFMMLPAAAVWVFGFLDERFKINVWVKTLFVMAVSLKFLHLTQYSGQDLITFYALPKTLSLALLSGLLLGHTLSYSVMEQADGVVLQQTLLLTGFLGMLAWADNAGELATLIWTLTTLMVGYFMFGWPKAKLQLGPSGQVFLGFVTGVLLISAHLVLDIPWTVIFVLNGLFITDTALTYIRRIVDGDLFWSPHRKHAYQRLLQSAWTESNVVVAMAVVNAILFTIAYGMLMMPEHTLVFSLTALAFLALLYALCEWYAPLSADDRAVKQG